MPQTLLARELAERVIGLAIQVHRPLCDVHARLSPFLIYLSHSSPRPKDRKEGFIDDRTLALSGEAMLIYRTMSPARPTSTDRKLLLCTANLANPRVLRRFSELAWRPEQPAPEQARLNADQQRMALMHADWPQAAMQAAGRTES
jgi:hypothetical protein